MRGHDRVACPPAGASWFSPVRITRAWARSRSPRASARISRGYASRSRARSSSRSAWTNDVPRASERLHRHPALGQSPVLDGGPLGRPGVQSTELGDHGGRLFVDLGPHRPVQRSHGPGAHRSVPCIEPRAGFDHVQGWLFVRRANTSGRVRWLTRATSSSPPAHGSRAIRDDSPLPVMCMLS